VGIVGKPNAGKSTLMNFVVGEKIAITTRKPQTTRNRIMGIRNTEAGQLIFLDTPGIHSAKTPLNRQMVSASMSVFSDVICCFCLSMPGTPIGEDDNFIVELLKKTKLPVVLVINKIDLIDKEKLLLLIDNIKTFTHLKRLCPSAR